MNAAISLLNLGIETLPEEAENSFELAKRFHAIRGNFFADDAPQQLNLGRLHVLDGNPAAAGRASEQSYNLDSEQPGIRFFMAVTASRNNGSRKPGNCCARCPRKIPSPRKRRTCSANSNPERQFGTTAGTAGYSGLRIRQVGRAVDWCSS